MAKNRSESNQRLTINLCQGLYDLLQKEIDFLGVGDRLFQIEERVIKTQSDLIRAIAVSYIQRNLDYEPDHFEQPDEETVRLDLYLDKYTRNLWTSALQQQLAMSHTQLLHDAVADYFYRQTDIADVIRVRIPQIQHCLKRNVTGLRELINA